MPRHITALPPPFLIAVSSLPSSSPWSLPSFLIAVVLPSLPHCRAFSLPPSRLFLPCRFQLLYLYHNTSHHSFSLSLLSLLLPLTFAVTTLPPPSALLLHLQGLLFTALASHFRYV